mgnify:CR=1 FL=1
MKNISIKAVIIGVVSLLVIDSIGGMLLATLFGADLAEGMPALYQDTTFLVLRTTLFGITPVVIAGYLTAKIAKRATYLNSGILGLISFILTLLVLNDSTPLWFNIANYLYQFPAGLLGGYVFLTLLQKQQALAEGNS